MTGSNNEIPIRCNSCGFAFPIPAVDKPIPVCCPSCGNEFVHLARHIPSTGSSPGVPLPGHPRLSAKQSSSATDYPRRWEILFLAVCIQFAVLVFSPLYIYQRYREKETGRQPPSPRGIAATTVEPAPSLPQPPPAPPAFAESRIAQVYTGTNPPGWNTAAVPTDAVVPTPDAASQSESFSANDRKTRTDTPISPVPDLAVSSRTKSVAEEKTKVETSIRKIDPLVPSPKPQPGLLPRRSPDLSPDSPDSSETSYKKQLVAAQTALANAREFAAVDSEKGMHDALKAVEMFRKLGQSIPSEAYWIIARAYASQSWGESLVDESLPIETFDISPDSRWMLTRTGNNTVWVWDILRTQKELEAFKLDSSRTFVKIVFTPDFRLAVGAEADGSLRAWKSTSKDAADSVIELPGKVRDLRELIVSPDGRWLVACGGSDDTSARRDIDEASALASSGTPPELLPERLRSYFGLLSGKPVEPGSTRPQFGRWPSLRPRSTEISRPAETSEKGKSENRIIQVNYQGSQNENISDDSHVVWLWDLYLLQNGVVPQPISLRGHEKPVRILRISDDSRWLLTGSEDATARIYNLKGTYPGADQAVLKGHQFGITAALFSPDSRWVATGSRDNTVRVWTLPDSKTPSASVTLGGHLGWISSLAADAAGERLVSGSYDQTIRVWSIPRDNLETATDREPIVIPNDQGPVRRLLLTKDGKILVSLGGDTGLRLRNLDGAVNDRHSVSIRNRLLPITEIALTPDNRWLVFSYVNRREIGNSGIRLWPIRFDDLSESASELVR